MRRSYRFPHTTESVTAARHLVHDLLAGSPSQMVDAVEMMVSELATNCIRHTRSAFTLSFDLTDQRVRIDVTDRGRGDVLLRSPAPTEPSGRGLRIVDLLSDEWGVDPTPHGKSVWFTVGLPTPAPGGVEGLHSV